MHAPKATCTHTQQCLTRLIQESNVVLFSAQLVEVCVYNLPHPVTLAEIRHTHTFRFVAILHELNTELPATENMWLRMFLGPFLETLSGQS